MTASDDNANGAASLSAFRTFELMQMDGGNLVSDRSGAVSEDIDGSKGFLACCNRAGSPRTSPTGRKGYDELGSNIQHRLAIGHPSVTSHALVYRQARRENLHRRMLSYPPATLPTPPTAHQLRGFMRQKGSHHSVEYEHGGSYRYEDPILDNAPRMPRSDRLRQEALAKQYSTVNVSQTESPAPKSQLFLTGKAASTRSPYPANKTYTMLGWPSDPNIIKQANAERLRFWLEEPRNARSAYGKLLDPSIINSVAPHSRNIDPHPTYADNTRTTITARQGGVRPITATTNANHLQTDSVIVRTRNYFEEYVNGQRSSRSSGQCHNSDTNLHNKGNMEATDREYRRQTTKDTKIDRFYIKRAECDFTLQATIKNVFKNGTPTAADIKSMMDAIDSLQISLKENLASDVDDPWYERITWIKKSVVGPHGRQVRTLKNIFRLLNGEGIMFRQDENSEVYKEAQSNSVSIFREKGSPI
ncbi:hypothetical protein P167DRAFT_566539 [Morchella conica CCBAS932]|uniref:Uncharacterized protein n=1 Tax=Morchella conica CCBAS932 TaxID=1392247 RepID=A0A3N4KLR0_9PEZI|nr:hypothetical protein P167DRAFT_566539 [Morchella conica CCBAS932]